MVSRIRRFRLALMIAAALLMVGAWQVWAAQMSTPARCGRGVTCDIGNSTTTEFTLTTTNAVLGVDQADNELRLTATGTNDATFIGADAAGDANTVYDTTGGGNITLGSGDVGQLTLDTTGSLLIGTSTTNAVSVVTDSTGNAELTVPDSSIGPDEIVGFMTQVIFCGDLASSGTLYYPPVTGFPEGAFYELDATSNDYRIDQDGCIGLENGTESTADKVMYTNTAFKILGLFCKVTGSGSNGVVVNLRSATADLTPDITITIATSTTTGLATIATTTDIAAGAVFALKAVTTEDLSAQAIWCVANIMLQ